MKNFRFFVPFLLIAHLHLALAEFPDKVDNLSKYESFRRAIAYLSEKYGALYPDADLYLARVESLETKEQSSIPRIAEKLHIDFQKLQYEAFITNNPLIEFDNLLFVKRYTYNSSHFYTDFIDGCEKFGGNICILSLKEGKVTELIPAMGDGIFGRYDLSFDAKRLIFDWKVSSEKGFRIYEVGIDGKGLHQLTVEPDDEQQRIKKYDNSYLGGTGRRYNHHTDDMHPCYLPDGGICFTSTRCEYGTLCDGPDILATTILYRMDGDGKNMEKLTNSSVSEFSPSIMEDGRVLYTRWEYIDKGQILVKCLWTMRPDGSSSYEIYGNDIAYPPSFMHGRQIPGHSNEFVFLGTPHYPQSGIGTVICVNTSKNIRSSEPMTYITPQVDIKQQEGWNFWNGEKWILDEKGQSGRLYMDPYPLDEHMFLVTCKANPKDRWDDENAYSLYLLDDFGNHTLIYEDREISCWQPIPLRSRKQPPVLASIRDAKLAAQNLAACLVQNVNHGLEGVPPGKIKYLRIMEQVPRPWGCRQPWDPYNKFSNYTRLVSNGAVFGLKVMHGVVPVYEDGSAHFLVPADKNIYLQALDENFLEIQRERTYINYRPGEKRSCIGCHESNKEPPQDQRKTLLALMYEPSEPQPQPGDDTAARVLHFPTDVQPVLDKHCVQCHGIKDPAAGLDLTGTMTTLYSNSYENLLKKEGLVPRMNEQREDAESAPYLPALTLGSGASKLIQLLYQGHQDVNLSREELIKISTWIDSNGQFYGSYYGRKNIEFKNHPNFRPVPTFTQAINPLPPLDDKER